MRKVQMSFGAEDQRLNSGPAILRNTAINIVGQVMPLAVGLITAPGLLDRLGLQRYAILNLSWVVVGYFSVFDLGLGRAVTYAVAKRSNDDYREIGDVVWPSFRLALLLGCLASGVLMLASSWMAEAITRATDIGLSRELRPALILLALSLPSVIASSILRGALEGRRRFDLANIVRLPQASLMFLGPWLMSWISPDLSPIAGFLLAIRVAGMLVMLYLVKREETTSIWRTRNAEGLVDLMRFGAWVTVGAIVAPVLVNIDRFLIGGLISLASVTYYVTAHDLMSRTWLVASSIASVYFPAFADISRTDATSQRKIYGEAIFMMAGLSLPLTLTLAAFSHEVLSLWLGTAIADHSADVLRILSFGGFVAALALVPHRLLQAIGQPKIVAVVQMAELPLFVLLTVGCANAFGIVGVGLAWVVRSVAEALVLDGLVRARYDARERSYALPILVGLSTVLFATVGLSPLPLRSVVWVVGAAGSATFVLRKWMEQSTSIPEESRVEL